MMCARDLTIESLNWTPKRFAAGMGSISWFVIFIVCLNIEVRGHWQPVDTGQIYATCTHTHTWKDTAQILPRRVVTVVSRCCWSFGPSSSRYQSLSYSPLRSLTLLIENGCRLRRRELKDRERESKFLCGRKKEQLNERGKELNLCRPTLIKCRMAVGSTVGLK